LKNSLLEKLIHIDQMFFKFIHVNLANQAFDVLMPFVRNPYFWAPLYLFLLVWMWMNYKMSGLIWCVFFLITFGFGDFISASILKPWVHRLRPCNDETLQYMIRDLVHCGSGYSFPSSHATNHFALSFFIIHTIGKGRSWIVFLCLLWASLIGFAQVYVGVHFPLDIIAGCVLGLVIGCWNAHYFKSRFGLKS
jgi:membrane-associated phospholipid phosphatase